MRIGLIDVDSRNFPNLPLMKLSAYHKAHNDIVEWYVPFGERYDLVYMSKVFSFSEDETEFINAERIIRGGSGYCITLENGKEVFHKELDFSLPDEVEHIYPDYSIYPALTNDTAYGFLTRGCPRGCDFCVVGSKEGLISHKVADLKEFWRGQKKVVLLDPNILACRDYVGLLKQLIDAKVEVDFNQGLDIRMMTEDKIDLLNHIKISEIHFAWDRYRDRDIVLPKLRMFADRYKKKLTHKAIVYTIVNFDTDFNEDLDRIYTLRGMGFYPFVMIYDKEHCHWKYKDLARWCNNRVIFAKCPNFEDYRP